MKKWILIFFVLSSTSVLASNSCQKALDDNEAAINQFGANLLTAQLGWEAYQTCKEDLDSEGQALATLIEGRCVRANAQDGSMYRSFAAQCALKGVLFLKRQQNEDGEF